MTRIATLMLGFLFVASPVLAQDPQSTAPPSTAEVLGKLHSSNVREIRMGKLARERGRSSEVRNFGKMLNEDYHAMDAKIVALAKEEGIVLAANTPAVGPLELPKGAAFDAAFARDTLADHQKDVAEVQSVRDATNDEKLRALLTEILPVLVLHEQMAQTLVDQQGSKP